MNPARAPGSRVLSLALRNDRRELARIGESVERFGGQCQLTSDDTAQINLMLDELVSNVIKYGYDEAGEHQIDVTVGVDADRITISVEDDGKPFNLLEAPPPNFDLSIEQRPVGGLGVFLVRSIADAVDYRRDGNRNVVTLTKKRRA